jgi:integrase
MLAILLGCGLRRRELAELKVEHLQRREERWAIIDLVGKVGTSERYPFRPGSRKPLMPG